MAHLESMSFNLQWGRRPDGKFFIAVTTDIATTKGPAAVPLYAWTLAAEEELALKATLSGVVIATNGHEAALAR